MQSFHLNSFSSLEQVALVCVAMVFSAVFSATEAAYISLDRVAIRRLERSSSALSKLVLLLVRRFSLYIITSLSFNTFFNFIAAFVAKKLFTQFWRDLLVITKIPGFLEAFADIGFIIVFSLNILLFCEFFPKRIALRYPVFLAKVFAPFLLVVYVLLYPFSLSLSKLITALLQLLKKWPAKEANTNASAGGSAFKNGKSTAALDEEDLFSEPFDRDQFISYVRISSRSGALHAVEGELLEEFLKTQRTAIRSFLIPREQLKAIDIAGLHFPDAKFITKLRRFGHENIPFYERDKDNIVGVLSQRDLVFDDEKLLKLKNCEKADDLKSLLDIPLIIPENKNVLLALKDIHESNTAMALVIDEHGGTQGVVIYKDILYKLFGGLDTDESKDEAKMKIQDIGRGYFQIDASISLSALNDFFSFRLVAEEAETLGGYLLEKFKRIPKRYDSISDAKLFYVVQSRSQRGIQKVIVHRIPLRKQRGREKKMKLMETEEKPEGIME